MGPGRPSHEADDLADLLDDPEAEASTPVLVDDELLDDLDDLASDYEGRTLDEFVIDPSLFEDEGSALEDFEDTAEEPPPPSVDDEPLPPRVAPQAPPRSTD